MTRPESLKNPGHKRPTVQLEAHVERRLGAYAMAASAAGVGMLALSHPVEAKVVYTPASVQIARRGSSADLDLNHDGLREFKLIIGGGNTSNPYSKLVVLPNNSQNAIWGTQKSASALYAGVRVGPDGPLQKSHTFMALQFSYTRTSFYTSKGLWKDVTKRYLGLRFVIDGKAHYGWARLNVTVSRAGVHALLTGYAYETVANKPIVTGRRKGGAEEPVVASEMRSDVRKVSPRGLASLGLLARGSLGSDGWRQRGVGPCEHKENPE
jgi:hypothetical protein